MHQIFTLLVGCLPIYFIFKGIQKQHSHKLAISKQYAASAGYINGQQDGVKEGYRLGLAAANRINLN